MLAGEYPGTGSRSEAASRIQALLRAGVNCFIDLTQQGELPPYQPLLTREGSALAEHLRHSIVDHGLPDSPQLMADILDDLARQLAAGRCVYVHCRAGIGRTGTVIGCHLVRGGLDNQAALDRLQVLWQQSARSRAWPSVPETDAQIEFVRNWREPAPATPAVPLPLVNPEEGALVGLAVGESFGIAQSCGQRELTDNFMLLAKHGIASAAPSAMLAGAEVAMTRAVAESLLMRGGYVAADLMHRFSEYIRSGQNKPAGVAAENLSPEFKRAVAAWQWSRKVNTGTHDPRNLDAHSLARSFAVALYGHADPPLALKLAVEVSRTTQQSPVVLDAVRIFTALAIDALRGVEKAELLALRGAATRWARQQPLRKELDSLLGGAWADFIPDDGGAAAVIARALLALRDTSDYVQGMQHLLEKPALPCVASAAVGATYGALAGALYGFQGIPEVWRQALPQTQALCELARSLGIHRAPAR